MLPPRPHACSARPARLARPAGAAGPPGDAARPASAPRREQLAPPGRAPGAALRVRPWTAEPDARRARPSVLTGHRTGRDETCPVSTGKGVRGGGAATACSARRAPPVGSAGAPKHGAGQPRRRRGDGRVGAYSRAGGRGKGRGGGAGAAGAGGAWTRGADRASAARDAAGGAAAPYAGRESPSPPPFPPVLTGHASSLLPY